MGETRSSALFTRQALERLGGEERCRRAFTEETAGDAGAVETLARVYEAGRKSAAATGQLVTTAVLGRHVFTVLLVLSRRGDVYLVDNVFYSILDEP